MILNIINKILLNSYCLQVLVRFQFDSCLTLWAVIVGLLSSPEFFPNPLSPAVALAPTRSSSPEFFPNPLSPAVALAPTRSSFPNFFRNPRSPAVALAPTRSSSPNFFPTPLCAEPRVSSETKYERY